MSFSVDCVLEMIDLIDDQDLNFRPVDDKKSIEEVLQHLCELIGADLEIMSGANQEEMANYYKAVKCKTVDGMRGLLLKNLFQIKETYLNMKEDDLFVKVTSYWGLEYSRFEWLVEILVHFTHHRAQLHMLLVQKKGNINITLF
ncbi:DinB family protein [Gottfriedia luciferensis]|uniref:DinB family protein n=1 Tax=Gottfriedia luciferensis TaxID=178774 RepID=UPI00130292B3|nr:DinB family protein [Gottfriedia luciferensis]